ncbi:hypothetical protein KKD57_04770 [Patescibacteria group bacterium]|nr:hypothetical protein [Patescibacteria group bacterium]
MNKLINGNKKILIAAILISGIGAGILGYWQYKNSINPLPTTSPTTSISPVISSNPASTPTITPPPEVWETYTNTELGFSIKYPQMVYGIYRCEPYKPFYVPIKIFDDSKNGITYITHEYYYEAPYSSELSDYTGPCEKIISSLESLKKEKETYGNPFLTWVINIKNIKNDSELNKFIKDNYGSTCSMEKKIPRKQQTGVYEITLKSEDWDKEIKSEAAACRLAMSPLIILYKPEIEKIMSVELGQGCFFAISETDGKDYQCYDNNIIDSFRFK